MNDSEASGVGEPIDASDDATPTTTAPARSRRLGRRTVIVTVVALGVAAGGGAIAAAAGGHGGGAGDPARGYGMARPEGGGMPGGPMMRAIHGTFVVPSTSGGKTTYVKDVEQTGTVTALSATSISLSSADGYTATYVIGSSTTKDSSVAKGSTATVIATGDPATALSVVVPGKHPARGSGGMPGAPGGTGPQARPSGAPSNGSGGPAT